MTWGGTTRRSNAQALGTVNLAEDGMSAEDVIGLCREMSEAGIQHLIFNMPNVDEIKPLVDLRGGDHSGGCRDVAPSRKSQQMGQRCRGTPGEQGI